MTSVKIRIRRKGGPGSGNWGHSGRPGMIGGSGPGSSAVFNPLTAKRSEMEKHGYIAVFRGTGAAGMREIRPSTEGMAGPGVYFYDNPEQARSYAEADGGIVTGFIDKKLAKVVEIPRSGFTSAHRVIVIPNASKFIRRGDISVEDTLGDLWKDEERIMFDNLVNNALNEVK